MKDKLLDIIKYYGIDHQVRKLDEEHGEIGRAIHGFEVCNIYGIDEKDCDYDETKDHIAEEIADNFILLMQFIYYYGLKKERLEELFEYKLNRTIEKMKVEKINNEKNKI